MARRTSGDFRGYGLPAGKRGRLSVDPNKALQELLQKYESLTGEPAELVLVAGNLGGEIDVGLLTTPTGVSLHLAPNTILVGEDSETSREWVDEWLKSGEAASSATSP